MDILYLITRLDAIHHISVIASIVSFTALLLVLGLIHLGLKNKSCKGFKIALSVFIISILIYVFVPTTIEALLIYKF